MDQTTSARIRLTLVCVAFATVLLCLAVTVWTTVQDEFAKGILTLVLGRMLGYVDAAYNYEFGTTRSSAKKDEAISDLTKTASAVQTQGVLDKAVLAATTVPAEAGNVSVKADTVTVSTTQKGTS